MKLVKNQTKPTAPLVIVSASVEGSFTIFWLIFGGKKNIKTNLPWKWKTYTKKSSKKKKSNIDNGYSKRAFLCVLIFLGFWFCDWVHHWCYKWAFVTEECRPYCRIARGKAGRQKHTLSHLTKQTLTGRWEGAVTNVTHIGEMFLVRK